MNLDQAVRQAAESGQHHIDLERIYDYVERTQGPHAAFQLRQLDRAIQMSYENLGIILCSRCGRLVAIKGTDRCVVCQHAMAKHNEKIANEPCPDPNEAEQA